MKAAPHVTTASVGIKPSSVCKETHRTSSLNTNITSLNTADRRMAMRMESYMALLAVMFAFIMVQMQITVDGESTVQPNATTIKYNSTVTSTTMGTRTTAGITGGGGTGGGTGGTGTGGTGTGGTGTGGTGTGGTGTGGTGTGGTGGTGTAGSTNALYSTSSSKAGCFHMLQHVLIALSFLQIIQ